MAENGMQSQSILMQKEDSKHLIDFKKKKTTLLRYTWYTKNGTNLVYVTQTTILPLAQSISNNRHILYLSEFPCASSFFL